MCREEQQPYCSVSFYASSTRPLAPLAIVLMVLPVGLALPWVVRKAFLEKSLSDKGPATFAIDVLWRVGLLGGSTYWVVEWVESVFGGAAEASFGDAGSTGNASVWWAGASLIGRTLLARIILVGSLVGGYVFWWNTPLNIEIQVTESPSITKKRTVTVLGFANTYGSAYLLFLLPFFAVLWTATQLSGQVVLALGIGAILCFVEVVDGQRDARELIASFESAGSAEAALDAVSSSSSSSPSIAGSADKTRIQARSPTLAEPIFLALLAHVLFFSTGHQAVFSSIQWKTAFVGFPVLSYPWSPALVSLNTFGVFVLAGLAVPLLATWAVSPVQSSEASSGKKVLVLPDALRIGLGMQLYFTTLVLGSATSAAILRRHLMVWKVFAPRFMLAGVSLLVLDVALGVAMFVGLGKVVRKVEGVFGKQM